MPVDGIPLFPHMWPFYLPATLPTHLLPHHALTRLPTYTPRHYYLPTYPITHLPLWRLRPPPLPTWTVKATRVPGGPPRHTSPHHLPPPLVVRWRLLNVACALPPHRATLLLFWHLLPTSTCLLATTRARAHPHRALPYCPACGSGRVCAGRGLGARYLPSPPHRAPSHPAGPLYGVAHAWRRFNRLPLARRHSLRCHGSIYPLYTRCANNRRTRVVTLGIP